MPLLDEDIFQRTFGTQMLRIGADGSAAFPFWPYVDLIPEEDYRGFDCSEGNVEWVWRDEEGRFEHILIGTKEDEDVFLVIVLDLEKKEVAGHRLMDFAKEFGKDGPAESDESLRDFGRHPGVHGLEAHAT